MRKKYKYIEPRTYTHYEFFLTFFLNELTALINKLETTKAEINALYSDMVIDAIKDIYLLNKPSEWKNMFLQTAAEIGITEYTREGICEYGRCQYAIIPLYLTDALPKKANIYTTTGEEIRYDPKVHKELITDSGALLEMRLQVYEKYEPKYTTWVYHTTLFLNDLSVMLKHPEVTVNDIHIHLNMKKNILMNLFLLPEMRKG